MSLEYVDVLLPSYKDINLWQMTLTNIRKKFDMATKFYLFIYLFIYFILFWGGSRTMFLTPKQSSQKISMNENFYYVLNSFYIKPKAI